MEVKEQINNFKSMVNSYKLTNLIITSNNIGIFNLLNEKSKTLLQISKELNIEENRIEPILNALTFNKILSKDEKGYYLEEYKDVLLKNSEYNQLGYVNFAQTIMKKYEHLENAIIDENIATNNFKELTKNNAESFMQAMDANAIPQANFIAEKFDFENHNILDIGAGAGTYLVTIANKYKTVTGKMIDLPEMVKIQNKRIEKENLKARLLSEECDYNISRLS